MGIPERNAAGTADVFQRHFGNYRTLVLAIGGALLSRSGHLVFPLAAAKVFILCQDHCLTEGHCATIKSTQSLLLLCISFHHVWAL